MGSALHSAARLAAAGGRRSWGQGRETAGGALAGYLQTRYTAAICSGAGVDTRVHSSLAYTKTREAAQRLKLEKAAENDLREGDA